MKKSFLNSFQRKTPKPKIDLNDKSKQIWVRKVDFKCFVSSTCLRTSATNSWYFNSRCSKHMIGD